MMKVKRALLFSCVGVWMLCTVFSAGAPAGEEDEKFRARLGLQIRSGDRVFLAKTHDKLTPGDLIRIYAQPEKISFVYVVHTDKTKATLLNMTEQRVNSCMLVLPSVEEYYQVDGKSEMEAFTIICSPTALHEFSAAHVMRVEEWRLLEQAMMEKSTLQLETSDRPFPIIGNVRSMSKGSGDPPIPVFSGKELLVKKYEFEVRKPASEVTDK